MNKETKHEYKGVTIVIIDAETTTHKHRFGYKIPEVFGTICYETAEQALKRAKQVIDNPDLKNGMMSTNVFTPKSSWFK